MCVEDGRRRGHKGVHVHTPARTRARVLGQQGATYGLYSYGLHNLGMPYIVTAYIVMAYIT